MTLKYQNGKPNTILKNIQTKQQAKWIEESSLKKEHY